jgi:hypothetical protein
MAILRVPRITTLQREPLILLDGEIVFDTDKGKFFGGNGVTPGGLPVGVGVPEGGATGDLLIKASNVDFDTEWLSQDELSQKWKSEAITITEAHVSEKKFALSFTPKAREAVRFVPDGGPEQRLGVDYDVLGNEILWNGLTLDGFLEVGEVIRVTYPA